MLTSLRPLGTGTNGDDDELRRVAQTIPYLLTKSRADNTVKTYSQGFKTWKEWSARYKNVESLPAHPYHVMIFIATLIQQSHSYSKIKNIFYAINWIHKMNNLPNPCKNNQVRLMKEAAKRLVSRAKVKKLPIKHYHLLKIARNNRNKKDLKKQRTITMILLGYAGFLRFQELSTLTLGDLIFSEQYVKIFIQKSKCDQYRSGSYVFIAKTGNATCPVRALKLYLEKTKPVRLSRKRLFIPVKGKGDVSATTISRWIRMAILKAYENMTDRDLTFLNIRAHEIRAFSTLWAYHNRVPIEDILQAASWRNHSTFSSFYLRSLSSQEEGLFRLGPIVSAQRVIHQ